MRLLFLVVQLVEAKVAVEMVVEVEVSLLLLLLVVVVVMVVTGGDWWWCCWCYPWW